MPDARLRMAGAGDDLPALRQLGEKLGIAHAIEWLGPLPAGAIPALYATATCTVDPVRDAPALRARSPLKIVESLAAGVPVATGDVGDRRAMLAGYPPDLLARPDDPADLARVILALLRDPFLNRDIAAISLSRSARYRIETLAHDWAEIYESRK